jgi:hypothetical protein
MMLFIDSFIADTITISLSFLFAISIFKPQNMIYIEADTVFVLLLLLLLLLVKTDRRAATCFHSLFL